MIRSHLSYESTAAYEAKDQLAKLRNSGHGEMIRMMLREPSRFLTHDNRPNIRELMRALRVSRETIELKLLDCRHFFGKPDA